MKKERKRSGDGLQKKMKKTKTKKNFFFSLSLFSFYLPHCSHDGSSSTPRALGGSIESSSTVAARAEKSSKKARWWAYA